MEVFTQTFNEKIIKNNKKSSDFFETIWHDIRNPLPGILGLATLIKESTNNAETKRDIDSIIISCQGLLNFLSEVYETSNISEATPFVEKTFDLEKNLINLLKINQPKAKQKGLELYLNHDNEIPLLIGDVVRLSRIALELISNALNYTEEGYIRVTTKLVNKNSSNVTIKIIVEDTGIGIPTEHYSDIFVKYKQLPIASSNSHKGNGLGLSIVKQFIEDLKGEIQVKSRPEQGTKFTCIMSFKEHLTKPESDISKISESCKIPNNSDEKYQDHPKNFDGSPKVLLVEDHEISATVTKTILSTLECQVDVAINGKDAIALAKKHAYDLIFMDIGLPDIDGYEATKQIRHNESEKGLHTPIFALTAHIDDDNKRRCKKIGINTVVTKPLLRDHAKKILDTLLGNRTSDHKLNNEIIDFDIIREIANSSHESITEILNLLCHSIKTEVAHLKTAYQQEDGFFLSSTIHKIIGIANYCGASRLKDACLQLQACINSGSKKSIASLYEDLVYELDLVENYLKNTLNVL